MDPVDIVELRQVTDLETARVLMEPSRLAIMRTLSSRGPRQLTVKEIAEELDEGQTKLYRHIKQLEEHGLIHVAETRVVSGIIEKRYAASQKRLTLDNEVLGLSENVGFIDQQIAATLDTARDYLHSELRAGRVVLHSEPDGPDLKLFASYSSTRMTPEKFAELRAELAKLTESYSDKNESPDSIPVLFQALLFAVTDQVDGSADGAADGAADS
jgi:DNA-binding transcriptional ArsR family regulator